MAPSSNRFRTKGRLVSSRSRLDTRGCRNRFGSLQPVSPARIAEWRAGARDIMFTAFYIGGLQTVGRHDSVRSAHVDPCFFEVLGVQPLLGGFSSGDFTAAPLRELELRFGQLGTKVRASLPLRQVPGRPLHPHLPDSPGRPGNSSHFVAVMTRR
jgi:hypothetical protein